MRLMIWAPYNHAILTRATLIITTDGKWISNKDLSRDPLLFSHKKKEELCEKWMQMAIFRATNGFSYWRDI
jgi:hypothetical protein